MQLTLLFFNVNIKCGIYLFYFINKTNHLLHEQVKIIILKTTI